MDIAKLNTKKLRSFSLAEMVVSLGIISIVTLMLFNVLILSIRVTYKSVARSFVREELSQTISLITRDIRNADVIVSCGETAASTSCEYIVDGEPYRWELCSSNTRICKNKILAAGGTTQVYISSDSLDVVSLEFSKGFGVTTNLTQRNILVTIVGGHVNPKANVTNVIRQQGISTRNYIF